MPLRTFSRLAWEEDEDRGSRGDDASSASEDKVVS